MEKTHKESVNMDLSIIIPVFNGAGCVSGIVENIQSYNSGLFSYEVLLIDDGSTDETSAVCSALVSKYNCVHYLRKENGGIASARNYGLSVSEGDYITFADQDDMILSGYDRFLKVCVEEQLDMIITAPYNRRDGLEVLKQRQFNDEIITDSAIIKKMAGKLIDGKYLSDDSVQSVSASVWNVIYRKSLLDKNGLCFKSFIDYEDDWIFNIEALTAAGKIAVTSDGYYCWNIHAGSESHRWKYIPDLLNKRKLWMKWLSGILESMDIDIVKQSRFVERVLIPRNIMICFNNACWRPSIEKHAIMREIRDACDAWHINKVNYAEVDGMDRRNKFLLWMLIHNRINEAYMINRNILKTRFH